MDPYQNFAKTMRILVSKYNEATSRDADTPLVMTLSQTEKGQLAISLVSVEDFAAATMPYADAKAALSRATAITMTFEESGDTEPTVGSFTLHG